MTPEAKEAYEALHEALQENRLKLMRRSKTSVEETDLQEYNNKLFKKEMI